MATIAVRIAVTIKYTEVAKPVPAQDHIPDHSRRSEEKLNFFF